MQERKQLLTVADWSADFQSGYKTSNTTQTSDDVTPPTAIVTAITNPSTSEVSTEISSTNPKSPITNVQEINSSVNNVKDEHENDLSLVTTQSNIVTVIDNSHKQESTDTATLSKLAGGEEGNNMDFATFDKMSVSVDTSDTSNDNQKDVQKPNENIQNDMKTF